MAPIRAGPIRGYWTIAREHTALRIPCGKVDSEFQVILAIVTDHLLQDRRDCLEGCVDGRWHGSRGD